jgi:glucosamine-6-phosphate deaminase
MARLNLLEETRYEKLPVTFMVPSRRHHCRSWRIAKLIRDKQAKGEKGRAWFGYRCYPHRRLCRTGTLAPEEGLSLKT